jgi:hypothetical protein
MDSPATAYRIAAALPKIKLVFILRDPVRRAVSHYLYSKQNLLEQLPFEQALVWERYRSARTPAPLQLARPWSYVARGFYADMLAPFFELFSREQIFITVLEELDNAEVVRLFRFLGVDSSVAIEINRRVNAAQLHESPSAQAVEYLRHLYAEPNGRLFAMLGRPDPWDYAKTRYI